MKSKLLKSMASLVFILLVSQINIYAADEKKISGNEFNNMNTSQVETGKSNSEKTEKISDNNENSKTESKNIVSNNEKMAEDLSGNDSLFTTVKQGGSLMIFIIILGIFGLTIIIERAYYYIKHSIWKKTNLKEYILKVIDKSESKYREQLDDELRDAFQIYVNSAEKGMALLNGIGNIAPIFGFLGTVIGMISAFASIAAATTVNAKVVAVGIQVALVTTAGGLIIAAPILASFHFFNHLIQNIYKYADEIIFEETSKLPSILKGKGE